MKRLFDILAGGFGLILLSPVFLIMSIVITLDSPGGVFFRGPRVGKNGKVFRIFKFRSMVKESGTSVIMTAALQRRDIF